jgi:hypothetical protein
MDYRAPGTAIAREDRDDARCVTARRRQATITAIEYPTALALTAWRGAPMPPTAEKESRRLKGELDMLHNSQSWRIMSVLRRFSSMLR